MHHIVNALPILRAVIPGRHDACPDGQAHEYINNQVIQGSGRPDRCQRVVSGELSHHHNVRRIKQKLKNTGKY